MADVLSMLGSPIETAKALWSGERLPGETDAEYQAKLARADMMSARAREQQAANAMGLPMPTLETNIQAPLPTSPVVASQNVPTDYKAPSTVTQPASNPLAALPLAGAMPPPSGMPQGQLEAEGLIPIQSQTDTESISYGSGPEKANATMAMDNWTTARNKVLDIQRDMAKDGSDYNKELAKALAASIDVKDTLDPSKPATVEFFNSIKNIREGIDTATKDLEKFQAEAKVDPRRYMKQMPLTDKIMNGLAMYLEGMAAAKAVGKGVAVPPMGAIESQLNRAMEQDIQFQKEEMKSQQEGKVTTINRLKDNMSLMNNERSAELKTKLDFLAATNANLQVLKQQYQGKVDTAAIDELQKKNELDAATAKLNLVKEVIKNSTISKAPGGSGIPRKEAWDMEKDVRADYRKDTEDAHLMLDQRDKMLENLKLASEGNSVAYNALKTSIARINTGVGVLTKDEIENNGMNANIYNRVTDFFTRNTPGDKLTDVSKADIQAFARINELAAKKKIAVRAMDSIRTAKENGLNFKNIVEDTDLEHMQWYSFQQKSKTGKPTEHAPALK